MRLQVGPSLIKQTTLNLFADYRRLPVVVNMSFRLPLGLSRSLHAHFGASTPITSLFRRQISSKPLALRHLLPPSPPPTHALTQATRRTSQPSTILASLKRTFASTAQRSVRSTYFPNRGGSPWGSSPPPSGWFARLRRRLDNQDPMHIVSLFVHF